MHEPHGPKDPPYSDEPEASPAATPGDGTFSLAPEEATGSDGEIDGGHSIDGGRPWDLANLTARADDETENRFTLRDLFLLITFCAVLSLGMARLPRAGFAGVMGIATILWMVAQSLCETQHVLIRYGWWALLGMYLFTCGLAAAGL